jgi:uncharacterized protein YcfJ
MNYKPLLGLAAVAACTHAAAQITFYEGDHFRGRTFATSQPVSNFKNAGFNDQASSVVVERGRWEVCDDSKYRGRCVVLRRGSYDSLRNMGLENRISSVRPAERDRQYQNEPQPVLDTPYEYRRRPNERLSEVPVTSVRAVVGPPEQRCWVEKQQVATQPQREYNVPGAIIGGVLGGILGHQIGGGTGKDIATVGGVVGGAAIGAHVNSTTSSSSYSTRDVRRCETTAASGPPQYYDVTYQFRGTEHRVQMASPPGRTITVNGNGEPRTT